jgi:hypothetical protein
MLMWRDQKHFPWRNIGSPRATPKTMQKAQIARLEELKKVQPISDSKGRKLYRKIHIYQGDFNTKIDEILTPANIPLVASNAPLGCSLTNRVGGFVRVPEDF